MKLLVPSLAGTEIPYTLLLVASAVDSVDSVDSVDTAGGPARFVAKCGSGEATDTL